MTEATLGVFTMAMIHGNNYDGPTYEHELNDARRAITKLEQRLLNE